MSEIKSENIEIIKKFDNGKYYDYISKSIIPEYTNEKGHSIEHINDVINRAFCLNRNLNLGLDFKLLSAAIFYHDIGRKIDDKTHEIISAKNFMNDKKMKSFFSEEERKTIKEAIEDHRASLKGKPRNIYGELVSSADRNTNMEQALKRTYEYRLKRNKDLPLEEKIRESFELLKSKFGKEGYASTVYFDDGEYEKYLKELRELLNDYDLFKKKYLEVNNINL